MSTNHPHLLTGSMQPHRATCEDCPRPATRKIGGIPLCDLCAAALQSDPIFRAELGMLATAAVREMAVAEKENAVAVAALEEIEAEHGGKGRVKIARVQVVEPIAVPPRKLPEYTGGRRGQGAEFVLKRFPDDPKVCFREGCDRKIYSRNLCQTCHRTARRRGILETLGLPLGALPRDGSRTNALQDKIEELARKKPGITLEYCVAETGRSRRHCYHAVQTLRKNKRLTRPKLHHHDPEYMRLYVVKP